MDSSDNENTISIRGIHEDMYPDNADITSHALYSMDLGCIRLNDRSCFCPFSLWLSRRD